MPYFAPRQLIGFLVGAGPLLVTLCIRPIEGARLVTVPFGFCLGFRSAVVDLGVDRYLILVGSGSGSVRIPSQIL